MTDPVTAGAPAEQDPTTEDLTLAAVRSIRAVVSRKWPGVSTEKLEQIAGDLLALALEVGDSGAVVLIPDNRPDEWRLADAVRATGTSHCRGCPNPPPVYDGQPAGQDLKAAGQVIRHLLTRTVGQ